MKKYFTKAKFGLATWGTYALIVATPNILAKVFWSDQMWGGPAFLIGLFLYPLIIFGMPFIAGIFASKYFQNNKGGWREGFGLGVTWFMIGLLLSVLYIWLWPPQHVEGFLFWFIPYFITINLGSVLVCSAVGAKYKEV